MLRNCSLRGISVGRRLVWCTPPTTAQRRLLQAEFGIAPAAGMAHSHGRGVGAADAFAAAVISLKAAEGTTHDFR